MAAGHWNPRTVPDNAQGFDGCYLPFGGRYLPRSDRMRVASGGSMSDEGRGPMRPAREPLPSTYTVDEVAAHLGVAPSTVRVAIQRGKLKAGKIGHGYRVTPSAVAEWLSQVRPSVRT